jgi:hypothetical protein
MEYIPWILLWFIVGASGFIFWWTRNFDLTTNEIFIFVPTGLLGPLSWLIGWFLHESKAPRTLIKRRK